MRSRRKRNLDGQLALYGDLLTVWEPEEKNWERALEIPAYVSLPELFGAFDALELEIGCGRGAFLCELARRNPEKAFLGVDVNKNVLVEACKKARNARLSNIRFWNCAAELLPRYLPPNSVSKIYLNFSCPFPKAPYAKRRLTHPRFLESYTRFCVPGAPICQRTDNRSFFDYSLEQYAACGYETKAVTFDLHDKTPENHIMTEYESKFVSLGLPICYAEARVPARKEEAL
ncbi:MAG: tRNA (guanosine(46)-N7)-methyltransferase TrmB [Clostridia bacterium]|nr:tRNA (guanosine(46)-N7)-methyltransferase TrmB [Clostridia bacterium]